MKTDILNFHRPRMYAKFCKENVKHSKIYMNQLYWEAIDEYWKGNTKLAGDYLMLASQLTTGQARINLLNLAFNMYDDILIV